MYKLLMRVLPLLTMGWLALQSCNKADLTGSDILPADDVLNTVFTDTTTLRTATVTGDSLIVFRIANNSQSGIVPSKIMVGLLNDPVFGKTVADVHMNLLPAVAYGTDYSDVTIDSVVLYLPYSSGDTLGLYGDFTSPQSLRVYELAEAMDFNTVYYSDKYFNVGSKVGEILGFTPDFTTKQPALTEVYDTLTNAHIRFDTVANVFINPQARIKLDGALGSRILTYIKESSTDADFLQKLRGVRIIPDVYNTGMFGFDITSTDCRLSVHYTRQSFSGKYIKGSVSLVPYKDVTQVKVVHLQNKYESGEVQSYIDNPSAGDELVFVQGTKGLFTKIEMPNITNLHDVIINRAELEVTIVDESNNKFPPPAKILVGYLDSEGNYLVIGNTETAVTKYSPKKYKIDLSTYVQDVIDGVNTNYPLFLIVSNRVQDPSRAVLGGCKHPQYPMKLNLTYTQLQ